MAIKTFYASKDALMGRDVGSSGSGGWNGKDNHNFVGFDGTYRVRSLIYFSIDFSGMYSITSATLYLITSTNNNNHTIQTSPPTDLNIKRVTSDWSEGAQEPGEGNFSSSMSWNWGNMNDKTSTSNQVTVSIDQDADGSEESIDITDIVNDWFSGIPNRGIMLQNASSEISNSAKSLLFRSRQASQADSPRLVIDYVVNSAPNAPTLNSPQPGEVVNSATPTFSVTRNDPDENDYITAVRTQAFNAGHTYNWSTTTSSGPAVGTMRFNHATYSSATQLFVNETDADGLNASTDLTAWSNVNVLIANADGSKYIYGATGTGVDNGTHRTFPYVPSSSSGIPFSDGEVVYLMPSATIIFGIAVADNTVNISGSPTSVSVPGMSNVAGNMNYMWRAWTADRGGLWSPPSAFSIFRTNTPPTAPTVSVAPLPLTAVPTSTPTITLTHNDNDINDNKMHGYQILVEGESSPGVADWTSAWDSGQIDTSASPTTTKAVSSSALPYNKSYRVRARTKDSNDAWSPFSNNIAFSTYGTEAPISLNPSDGGSAPATPTMSGERGSASYAITSYQIEVYSDDLQTLMWDSGTLSSGLSTGGISFSTTYAGSTLTVGSFYKWRVRVTSSLGTSDYTSFQRFQISDATVPTLSVPITTGISTITPTFTGSRAASFNAFQYQLYPSTASSAIPGTPLYDSGTQTATIGAGGLGTQFTKVYPGSPAIEWGAVYKWRARVSSDAGSNWSDWSGMASFTTLAAAIPTLTSVGGVSYPTHPWTTDTTPDFVITRGASDTIDLAQVRVYNATGTTLIWDSGMVNVANATTATITYAGTTLTGGRYTWDARYTAATSGAVGGYATKASFTINSAPNIPINLSPAPDTIVADTLLPAFYATFSDPDTETLEDTPLSWDIEIEEDDGTPVETITVSSGLSIGQNMYQYLVTDTTLAYNQEYRWRTRYQDSKSAYGSYSAWTSFILRESPNGTIVVPSDGSIVNVVNPQIRWEYDSVVTQQKFSLDIDRTDSSGAKISDVYSAMVVSSLQEYTVPSGYLKDNEYYNISLTVYDDDNTPDPTPSTVNVLVEQNPPDAVTGLSPTSYSSGIGLEWDIATMKTSPVVHKFVAYRIYRRLVGDIEWQQIGEVLTISNSTYMDYYAGNNVTYQYRVTVVVTVANASSVEIESPDDVDGGSFCEALAEIDSWSLVGADRSQEHILVLPVTDENHNRVVQQETFETLGSNRKVILRGFVLGHEGSITCTWTDNLVALEYDPQRFYKESVIGRRLLDYITANKGPHILKSPFGDVWDVEFAGPQYQWGPGGNLEVTLEWVEVGATSQVSI